MTPRAAAAAVAAVVTLIAGAVFLPDRSEPGTEQPQATQSFPRPGGAIDPPSGAQPSIPSVPAPQDGAVSEDGSTAQDLASEVLQQPDELHDRPSTIDDQVEGFSSAEEVAARFVLGLHTWTWEQPEAARVADLAELAGPTVAAELTDRRERWDDIDAARAHGKDRATARLSSLHAEPAAGFGTIRVFVHIVRIEQSRYGSREHRELVEVEVRPGDTGPFVDAFRAY